MANANILLLKYIANSVVRAVCVPAALPTVPAKNAETTAAAVVAAIVIRLPLITASTAGRFAFMWPPAIATMAHVNIHLPTPHVHTAVITANAPNVFRIALDWCAVTMAAAAVAAIVHKTKSAGRMNATA